MLHVLGWTLQSTKDARVYAAAGNVTVPELEILEAKLTELLQWNLDVSWAELDEHWVEDGKFLILWILILVGVFFLTLRDYHLISSLNFCDSFVALVKVGAKLCVQRLCCLSCKLHFCPQQLPKKKVQTFPQHLKSPRLATNSSNKLPPRSLT